MLPNLLVIGAMKAGTTSLHAYLDQHPDIFMSKVKELDYFVEEKFKTQSWDWYKQQFPVQAKIRGESSQNYTKRHHPDFTGIPERIRESLTDVKLIYLVRDPVERMRSHLVENYFGDLPKRRAFNQSIDHYKKTSQYYYQLEPYIELFAREQILIVQLEKLQSNRLEEMNRIFRFLGISEIEDSDLFSFRKNQSTKKEIPFMVKRTILYRAINRVAPSLANWIFSNALLLSVYRRAGKKPDFSLEEIYELKAFFHDDVQSLRDFSGMAFEPWEI